METKELQIVKLPIHFNYDKCIELNGETFESKKELLKEIKKLPLNDNNNDADIRKADVEMVEIIDLQDLIYDLNNENYPTDFWTIYVYIKK